MIKINEMIRQYLKGEDVSNVTCSNEMQYAIKALLTGEVDKEASISSPIGLAIASLAGKLSKEGSVVPTGTVSITRNGTHDVSTYANAEVNVPGIVPSGSKYISSNGDHDISSYATVYVDVPSYEEYSIDLTSEQVANLNDSNLGNTSWLIKSDAPEFPYTWSSHGNDNGGQPLNEDEFGSYVTPGGVKSPFISWFSNKIPGYLTVVDTFSILSPGNVVMFGWLPVNEQMFEKQSDGTFINKDNFNYDSVSTWLKNNAIYIGNNNHRMTGN